MQRLQAAIDSFAELPEFTLDLKGFRLKPAEFPPDKSKTNLDAHEYGKDTEAEEMASRLTRFKMGGVALVDGCIGCFSCYCDEVQEKKPLHREPKKPHVREVLNDLHCGYEYCHVEKLKSLQSMGRAISLSGPGSRGVAELSAGVHI
ncbi:hypothetical protein STEG23_013327 [Scotinomys teguina]